VDGGGQKRSFTFIDDAMECLLAIIENPNGIATRRIFNIGNPGNCASIRELAQLMIEVASEFPVADTCSPSVSLLPTPLRRRHCAISFALSTARDDGGR
jgi:nucleoside-diphosphate-sugar epimerase